MKTAMKKKLLIPLALISSLLPSGLRAEEPSKWSFDTSLYMLLAGMSGNVTAKGVTANVDVDFGTVVDNLEFGAAGSFRVGYDRWALTTEISYVGLGISKGPVSADIDQWLVEPTISYRVCKYFEPLAGVRYNNLSGEIRGPFGRNPTGTQEWYDPIIGAKGSLPLTKSLSFDVRGDIGGFGVGSDLTWQAFPYLNWRFAKWGSAQLGYRWVFNDYKDGSGGSLFRYNVLMQGPQIGFTFHF